MFSNNNKIVINKCHAIQNVQFFNDQDSSGNSSVDNITAILLIHESVRGAIYWLVEQVIFGIISVNAWFK